MDLGVDLPTESLNLRGLSAHFLPARPGGLYGFGKRGFKPFRFLFNELEEPVEVVARTKLARMTFEGEPITFRPDVSMWIMWVSGAGHSKREFRGSPAPAINSA